MADTTTKYDIKVQYMLDDRASKGLASIGREAKKSSSSMGFLSKSLGSLAAGAAGLFTFRAAKKYLVDYNAQLEQANIKMSGLLQMNMGGSWAKNQERANTLVKQFQEDAKKSAGTTMDFVDMGSMLTGPLSRAGAGMKEIRDITKGAVIAASAFGIEAQWAANDIESALNGTLSTKDRFARALLEPMGYTTEKWNKMVKETPAKATEMLMKAFTGPAISRMADEQANSWAGVASTLEDNLQRALGSVGLPLMKAMGAELQRLNEWFDKNPEKVAQFASDMASGLVTAFGYAKKIFGFIIDNKELLLTLAKAYLVGKAASGIAGAVGGTFTTISNFASALAAPSTGLAGFASKLGGAAAALGVFAAGTQLLADTILADQEKRIKVTSENTLMMSQARILAGAKGGAGTGVYQSNIEGAQRNAIRLGMRDDVLSGTWMGRFAGAATAGDKLNATRVAREAREGKYLDKSGNIGAGQAMRIARQFDIGNAGHRGSTFMGLLESKAGGATSIADTLAAVREINAVSGTEQSRRMEEFLVGLDRAMSLDARTQAEKQMEQNLKLTNRWQELMVEHKGNMETVVAAFGQEHNAMTAGIMRVMQENAGKPLEILKGIGTMFLEGLKTASGGTTADADADPGKKIARPSGNNTIKISKIEVVSDDPDRFAINLVSSFDGFMKNPTQAARALREG